MLRNYLQVAIRTMRRSRVYPMVNIVGLSIGLASAILITTFIRYELSYESFLPEVDQLYRVTQWQADNYFLGSNEFTVTQAGLANTIEEEIPEVQYATSFENSFALLGTGDQFYAEEGLFADDQFFNVFGHTLLVGEAPSVLVSPESIALSESLARRLFATADPRGEVVEIVI